jgi:peptidoglycan/LPS O-acetylase OafA/YrhL
MQRKFTALNGLRIFAALSVVCFHYGTLAASFPALPRFARNLIENGTIALPFFYVLSGFVLTHAYSSRGPASIQKRNFYFARIVRLFPAYAVAFVLFLPIAVEKYLRHPVANTDGVHTYVLGGLLSLFALQAWTPLSQAWNGPGWSLSVEAFFYFIFPLVLPIIVKMRPARLAIVLGFLWFSMISLTIAHEHNVIPPGVWGSYIMYQPLFWMPTFLLGMATYRLTTQWSLVPNRIATVISVTSLASLLVLAGLLSPRVGGDFLVNGGAAPLIALIVLAYSHPRSLSTRVLGSPPLEFLGAASYVIYILQAPLWHIFRAVTDHLRHAVGQPVVQDWQVALYFVYLVGLALLIQRFVERPAQQYLSRKGTSGSKSAAESLHRCGRRRSACGSMSMQWLRRENTSSRARAANTIHPLFSAIFE